MKHALRRDCIELLPQGSRNRKGFQKPRPIVSKSFAIVAILATILPGTSRADSLHDKGDRMVLRTQASDARHGWTQVIVQAKGDITAAQEKTIQSLGGYVYRHLHLVQSAAVRIPRRNLNRFAALPWVHRLSTDAPVRKHDEFIVERSGADVAFSNYGVTGNGVTVAVIDSGVSSTHPDLADSLLGLFTRVIRGTDLVKNGYNGDPLGHGTHVAGIIAGNGYSSRGIEFSRTFNGIAPKANLVDVRVLDKNGDGLVSDVISGIEWVITNQSKYRIRAINLSLGHPVFESYTTDPLCQAVEKAWKSGIVVVCSAGNFGRRKEQNQASLDNEGYGTAYGTVSSPGNDPYVITVGAMKPDVNHAQDRTFDRVATYSSRGPSRLDMVIKPDIVAPGNRVISLEAKDDTTLSKEYGNTNQILLAEYVYYRKNSGKTSSRYFRLSGTSMAAPVVTGAVALMLEKFPNLSPDTVKARLMLSADKWGYPDSTPDLLTFGSGYLDIPGALANSTIVPASTYSLSPTMTVGPDGYLYINMDATVWSEAGLWGTGVTDLRAIWGGAAVMSGTANVVNDQRAIWGKANSVQGDRAIWGGAAKAGADVSNRAAKGDEK